MSIRIFSNYFDKSFFQTCTYFLSFYLKKHPLFLRFFLIRVNWCFLCWNERVFELLKEIIVNFFMSIFNWIEMGIRAGYNFDLTIIQDLELNNFNILMRFMHCPWNWKQSKFMFSCLIWVLKLKPVRAQNLTLNPIHFLILNPFTIRPGTELYWDVLNQLILSWIQLNSY